MVILAMVFLGSILMVYNIYGFIRFSRFVSGSKSWKQDTLILNVPIVLLVFFLLGYIGIGIFGRPDLLVASILFGGSIFVFIMYKLLFGITRRVMEQERLEAELTAAEESNNIKNRFLATMSHEMRTPLNMILGTTSVALKDRTLPDKTREQFRRISLSGEHLLQMINNMLDINIMDTEDLKARKDVFSMKKLLARVNEAAETLCSNKNIDYRCEVREDVGERYVGDISLMEQILLSILNNAAKFTEAPGTVSLLVEDAGTDAGHGSEDHHQQTIRFVIADTGVGIDEEFLPKLYDLFSTEHSGSTSRFGGSGVGLAATKRKVDILGGEIGVESSKDVGSVFTVTIPLQTFPSHEEAMEAHGIPGSLHADASAGPAAKAGSDWETGHAEAEKALQPAGRDDTSRPEGASPGGSRPDQTGSEQAGPEAAHSEDAGLEGTSLEGRRILIVEDIPDNAEIVADLLELEGAESEHAENGQIAIDMFRKSPPGYYDAVLMDLRMPVMDGLEATKGIRALDRPDAAAVPILALTANAFERDVQHSMDAGMNEHLVKPVDPDRMYDALKQNIVIFDNSREGTGI